MGQEMRSALQISACEKNAKWAAKMLDGPAPYEVTQTLAAEGSGTRLITVVEGDPKGFLKIAEGMLQAGLQRSDSCLQSKSSDPPVPTPSASRL